MSYEHTVDARIYAWAQHVRSTGDVAATLACLHDHAIADALDEALAGRPVVGVMGGHALARGEPAYAEAARLGRELARAGLRVATGGGPGAMEAANLGAYLSAEPADTLTKAVELLGRAPAFQRSITSWARAAFDVRERWPAGRDSIGIPTWFYGHEPPNAFASRIAKFFFNALSWCTAVRRGSCSSPEQPAPCKKSSKTAARTTTPPPRPWLRWCSSASSTGPVTCPPGPSWHASAAVARWHRQCTSWTRSRKRWRLSE